MFKSIRRTVSPPSRTSAPTLAFFSLQVCRSTKPLYSTCS